LITTRDIDTTFVQHVCSALKYCSNAGIFCTVADAKDHSSHKNSSMNRRKVTPADALIELLAALPWWIGVLIALLTYVVLHYVAGQSVPIANRPVQMGVMVTHMMWQSLAKLGQYLLPFLCVVGAGISAWRRKVRRDLLIGTTQKASSHALDDMSWREFEMLVGEGFRLKGYKVTESGGAGPDGGVDLTLAKGNEKFLVQCKQWRALSVGVSIVRELYGVMAARGAAGGFVVTSGRFTDDAVKFASGRNITLLDGPSVRTMLKQAAATTGNPAQRSILPSSQTSPGAPLAAPPPCPLCQKVMTRRTAKRGAKAGADFWGCKTYPACRGTRKIN
jgi:restriction system protein